jgi:glycosyltransferase involved in cell wall biosynthesis
MHGLVSILIPVYNSAKSLERCIASCLAQDYSPIEIIIINDGSNEGDYRFLAQYDTSIVHYYSEVEHRGIAATRNQLLQLAKGEFIAWIDADDFMLPSRIKTQVAFLNAHPHIDIVGSYLTDTKAPYQTYTCPQTHAAIKACLKYKNCLFQPSILSRHFYIKEGIQYDVSYGNIAEDYALWQVCIARKTLANLPIPLTAYDHPSKEQLDSKRTANQFKEKSLRLHASLWTESQLSGEETKALHHFLYPTLDNTAIDFERTLCALEKLNRDAQSDDERIVNAYYTFLLWAKAPLTYQFKHISHMLKIIAYRQYKQWFKA